jgi:hypothetical protein
MLLHDSRSLHPALRPKRLTVSGGSSITSDNARFCHYLGRVLAGQDNLVIITGGLKYLKEDPSRPTADWKTIEGVVKELHKKKISEHIKVETILPDKKKDYGGAERFECGNCISLSDRSPRARRFNMVNTADAMITIQGESGVKEMIDLALAVRKPVLTLPFTGGASKERWEENRCEIIQCFEMSDKDVLDLESIHLADLDDVEIMDLAERVVKLLIRNLGTKCFVIMPFKSTYNKLYDEIIKPVLNSKKLNPIRTDRLNLSGNIIETIRTALISCDCCLADISDVNPNVMYEIGIAHAHNKPVAIICDSNKFKEPDFIPYDIRGEFIIFYETEDDLRNKLETRFD